MSSSSCLTLAIGGLDVDGNLRYTVYELFTWTPGREGSEGCVSLRPIRDILVSAARVI